MHSIEALEPFGVRISAASGQSLSGVPPRWLDELAQKEKLVVLRGFGELGREGFLSYCRSFPGRGLVEWDFGPVMEMREAADARNYLFSRERVPFHWDGAFHQTPSYLMFYCVEAPSPGGGGGTLFCDTERIWAEASPEERSFLSRVELRYETKKLAHYGGVAAGALVRRHPATGRTVLRFAEPVETALNPVSMEISGIPEAEHARLLAEMRLRIYSPAYCYRHEWEPRDVLVADNHALIHAREAFERDCPRHLRRIQLL